MDCFISQRDSLLCTNLNEFNRSISWETKINSCVGGGGGGPWLMAKSFPRPPTHHQQCSLDGGRERTNVRMSGAGRVSNAGDSVKGHLMGDMDGKWNETKRTELKDWTGQTGMGYNMA